MLAGVREGSGPVFQINSNRKALGPASPHYWPPLLQMRALASQSVCLHACRLLCCRHARSIGLFKEGLDAFQQRYPFLVTTSLRSGAAARR